jgi:hypothetical protein
LPLIAVAETETFRRSASGVLAAGEVELLIGYLAMYPTAGERQRQAIGRSGHLLFSKPLDATVSVVHILEGPEIRPQPG